MCFGALKFKEVSIVMKKIRVAVIAAVAVLMLVFGAVSAYALSADQGKAQIPAGKQAVPAEYAAEEMAVGAYYENLSPEAEGEMA